MHRQIVDFYLCAPTMMATVRRLRAENIYYQLLTPHHIKADNINFYPGRGTIYREGDPKALNETGIDAFILLIKRMPTTGSM